MSLGPQKMKNTIDNKTVETARSLLDTAYHDLGFHDGSLLITSLVPKVGTKEADEWLEKGDWLTQAWRINAETRSAEGLSPACRLLHGSESASSLRYSHASL